MSHVATKWAFDQPELHRDMKPSEWAVLMVLADCHNPVQGCFPSQSYICTKTNLSERTVRDQLLRLRSRQLINWAVERGEGHRDSNRYALSFEPGFVAALPAESAGSPTGNPEPDQPAESDETNRQNLPPNLVREPVREPVEREAGARGPEEARRDAELLAEAIRLHPAAAFDDHAKIETAALRLTTDELREAVAKLPDWVAAAKKAGRAKLLGLAAYFGQKAWTLLAEDKPLAKGAELADGRKLVGLLSRPWWWLCWRRFGGDADAERRLKFQFQMANAGSGVPVAAADLPGPDDEAKLVRIGSDTEAAAAWLRALRDRGCILRMGINSPYIWAPSEWPPDDKTKAMALEGHAGND